MQADLSSYRVRVFHTSNLSGTTAVVYCLEQPLSAQLMQQTATQEAAPATCFIWPSSKHLFNIRFFNETNEIQLCGHGLLASARVVVQRHGLLEFKFLTVDSKVKAQFLSDTDSVEIAFSEPELLPVKSPSWLEHCFNTVPMEVLQVGPEDGYWVMRWRKGNLQKLEVNTDELVKHTRRAVIATEESGDETYDYYFRYFAPQHGVIEDKATGSAHRVLTSYWGKLLNKCNLKARQYSKEGAALTGRIDGGDVWISGNVSIER